MAKIIFLKRRFHYAVSHLYRRNDLHALSHACSITLRTDLEYWGIDEQLLNVCCAMKHYPEMEIRRNEYEEAKKNLKREEKRAEEGNFGETSIARYRKAVWNLTEYPESSFAARVRI